MTTRRKEITVNPTLFNNLCLAAIAIAVWVGVIHGWGGW